ncbi:MAG: insulinase family protein [Anaplasmataceae bacterium]|nr:insulinase family protein [Anaplasmataceae bacterium]
MDNYFGLGEFQYYKLNNGMEVYLLPYENDIPVVGYNIIYKVGAYNEIIGHSGIAHYLEHLMFRSSDRYNDIFGFIAKNSAVANATTSRDWTYYNALVPQYNFEKMMYMEADRMNNIAITKKNIELEKKIVLEELNAARSNSSNISKLYDQMHSVFYTNERSWNIIGFEDEIKNASVDDVMGIYKKYYRPSNAIIVIVGNYSMDKIIPILNETFGKIKDNKESIPIIDIKEPRRNSDKEMHIFLSDYSNANNVLAYMFRVADTKIGSKEQFTIEILAKLLGIDNIGKLCEYMVHSKEPKASYCGIEFNYNTRGDKVFGITLSPSKGIDFLTLDTEFRDFIKNLKKGKLINNNDLSLIKESSTSSFIYLKSNIRNYKDLSLQYLVAGVEPGSVDIPEIVNSITIDDINLAINKVFDFNNGSVTGSFLPQKDTK